MVEFPLPNCKKPVLAAQQMMMLAAARLLPPEEQGFFAAQVTALREAYQTHKDATFFAIAVLATQIQDEPDGNTLS